jgi:hypothetical protein
MSKSGKAGYRVKWLGDVVVKDFETQIKEGWTQVGLAVETEAKANLFKGHGVVTGTLRRSIHIAQPGYNWKGDDVPSGADSTERGRKKIEPVIRNGKVMLQIGSGMVYALFIEIGGAALDMNNSFGGYGYLRGALAKVKPKVKDIMRAYVQRQFTKKKRGK